MSSLIPKLDVESRQVLFTLVARGAQNGTAEITPAGIAALLLRAPRVEEACLRLGVSSSDLIGTLESLDAKSKPASPGVAPAGAGMFAALPLSGDGQRLLESLTVEFANATEQSVTPAKLLASILEHNDSVRDLCTRHGLTAVQLRAGDVA